MKMIAATRNRHKLEEFARMLEPLGFSLVSQEEVCPGLEVEEDGETFAENARKKALAIFRRTGLPAIADDSGICVDALGGAPGVHSARYADDESGGHDDKANNRKLLRELEGVPAEGRGAVLKYTAVRPASSLMAEPLLKYLGGQKKWQQ